MDASIASLGRDRPLRHRPADGLREGLEQVKALEQRFEAEVRVPGEASGPNAELENPAGEGLLRAGQLMLRDAWQEVLRAASASTRATTVKPGATTSTSPIAAWEHNSDGEPIRQANRCSSRHCNQHPGYK